MRELTLGIINLINKWDKNTNPIISRQDYHLTELLSKQPTNKISAQISPYLSLLSCSIMSDSVRPHRQQPTRLPRPWDSSGKNTGVACHFLLQFMKVKSESEVAQLCLTVSDPMDCSLPGSCIHGIYQARVLEWGAISFSHPIWTLHKSLDQP